MENPLKNGTVSYRMKNQIRKFQRYASVKNGEFSIQVYEQFEYEISAENNSAKKRGYADWIPLEKDNLDKEIKLVLKTNK